MTYYIDGPLGLFALPSIPATTRDHVYALTMGVFGGEYDSPKLPSKARSILDIGSGWGAFAIWASARWAASKIDCYDPHEEATKYLIEHVPWATPHLAPVTPDTAPLYGVSGEWGSGHTAGRKEGVAVAAVHPRDLPMVEVLKTDCEGTEAEILEHYPHLAQLSALIVEWHSPALHARCHELVAQRSSLRCVREATTDYGVSIWVQP
jgi:hypothetical protein